MRWFQSCGIAGTLLSFLLTGCGGGEPKKDHIGLAVALSGPNAKAGEEVRRGAELALAGGLEGVAGRKLVLLSNDTASKPDQARAMAVRMIHANKVVALIGGDPGPADHEAAWACQNSPAPETTPFLSAAGPDDRLTQLGPFVFAAGLSEEARGRALGAFAVNELKAERIAVLHLQAEEKDKLEAGLAESFIAGFVAGAKGKTVRVQRGKADELKPFVGQLKSKDTPQVVVLSGPAEAQRRLRSLLGAEGPAGIQILAGGCGEPEALLATNPGEFEGVHFCTAFSADDAQAAEFVKKFEAQHRSKPTAFAALGHDAARLVFEAVKEAKSVEPAKVRDSLSKLSAFAGVSGPISFDENRRARRPAFIVQVVNGQLKSVKKLPADGY